MYVFYRFKQRFKDAQEALANVPLTKEQKIRQKFDKMKKKPLPVTQGVKFRGLAGKLRKEAMFTQCFASLYKYMRSHYCYRAECFRFCVQDEIAEIAHSCQVSNTYINDRDILIILCCIFTGITKSIGVYNLDY